MMFNTHVSIKCKQYILIKYQLIDIINNIISIILKWCMFIKRNVCVVKIFLKFQCGFHKVNLIIK